MDIAEHLFKLLYTFKSKVVSQSRERRYRPKKKMAMAKKNGHFASLLASQGEIFVLYVYFGQHQ